MAFFLESTFVGLFFFGWDRLSPVEHLIVTWLVAIGSNLSALWILIANGWMQYPVGAEFNSDTMRMEVTSFSDVLFNPVAQAKFVHTVSAGYVVGSMFVLSISAWYLLRGRNVEFAKRSMTVAASFGLASALSVVVLGDESGYTVSENQKMKLAAIEAMWETEPPPAPFTAFGLPDVAARTTHFAIEIPWVMGIIATRSLDSRCPASTNSSPRPSGASPRACVAYGALQKLRADRNDAAARATFDAQVDDLGYALLLKRTVGRSDAAPATADIARAAASTIPNVPVLFWSFRIMVGVRLLVHRPVRAFVLACLSTRKLDQPPLVTCELALWSLPLPWLAAELGWIVAEYGRQPWAIEGVLPTALGVSSVSAGTGRDQPRRLRGLLHRACRRRRDADDASTSRKGPDGLGMWRQAPLRHAAAAGRVTRRAR